VAAFLALAEVNALAERPEFQNNVRGLTDLAGYLATIENGQTFGSLEGDRGVGTFGGSEDHTAILCGRPGQVSQYAYCPVRFQRTIAVPAGFSFAVGSSSVVAEKTGAAREKYNAASRLAATLAELWRRATGGSEPHLAAILTSGPDAGERLRQAVQSAEEAGLGRPALLRRLDHFLVENEQVLPAAGDALDRGDLAEFGALVDRSQRAAEELLGNQVPETSHLAASARTLGAAAASAFGAGFGGSVWALVEESRADEFLAAWAESYRGRFPAHADRCDVFLTGAGRAAFQVG
jgi:galactokinase